ncbi:MAG TPA: CBS domain-containing protein [Anaerolineae bacterium]|nr:CBS domain-containing protein [Anaerolineae bacterium]
MPYVSELLGKPVADVDGVRLGHLDDLIAVLRGDVPHPVVTAIVVKRSRGNLIVPMSDVVVLIAPAIPLTKQVKDIEPYHPGEREVYLVRDVLDKQIIDTNGVRVVRVNDLELTRVNGDFYVANVDISGLGLMRRLGMGKVAQRFTRKGGATGTISWDEIELLSADQPMRLRVPSDKITELHPADLAEIISDLTRSESDKLLESLDVETVAEALEEVEPEFQAALVETMPDERVADVLEEMSPDAAADLLAELPEDRSEDLLNLMEKDEAADVRKLLSYPIDTAGGLMTTEYVAIRPDLTAEQAIAVLREEAAEAETIYYVYVTDEHNRLVGIFSLSDLVLAKPQTPITDFMHRRVVTVNVNDSQDDVAHVVSKYNLLAVPVVDDQHRLHGIVTADDALDKIIPTAWKKKIPRLFK